MSVTIILSADYLPWIAASDDDPRPVLTGVWFDPCGAAVATDTHIMAVCPFSLQGDGTDAQGKPFAGALVPAAFLKEAHRQRGKLASLSLHVTGDTVACLGRHGRMEARLIEGQFPTWKRVVPDLVNGAPVPIPLVNVNPSLYVRLRDALGLKAAISVPLAAPGGEKHAFVMPGEDGAFGVLMPTHHQTAHDDYGRRLGAAGLRWLCYNGKGAAVTDEVQPAPLPEKVPMKPVLGTREKPRKEKPVPVAAEEVPAPVAAEEVPAPVVAPVPVPVVEPPPALPPVPVPIPSRLPAWLAGHV